MANANNTTNFSLGFPDFVTLTANNREISLPSKQSKLICGKTEIEFANDGTIWLTSSEKVSFLKLRWNYTFPLTTKFLGDAWERSYGELSWQNFAGSRFMPWYFLATYEQQGEKLTLGFGVKVRPSAMCYWQADRAGITLFLDVRCGGEGVELNGRKLCAAQIVCMQVKNIPSFTAAQEFCKMMCDDPILPDHPVYGSNNWYYAYGDSSEEQILADTDYVLKLTKHAKNPPYMVIDDCWQEHHRLNEYNGGPWRSGNAKFPDMKRLASKLIEKGVKAGIWFRPLQNEDENIPKAWRLAHNDCLDPSNPDALNYIAEDVKRICDWGFTLIKHDFSTYDMFGKWGFEMNPLVTVDGWSFSDKSKTSAEIVKDLYQTIYDASRENNAIIIGCNTIGHLAAGLTHIDRTGDDTSGLNWERTRRMGINTLAFRLPQHKTFFEIDADCVGIAGNIPWELNKQWADVLAKSGTPLFLSVKPNLLTAEQENELAKIIAIASEQKHHYVPTDWEYTDCPAIWSEDDKNIEYNWVELAGANLDCKQEKYCVYVPKS